MWIDPRAKTLRHIDRIAAWDRGESPAPVTVEWDLSNRCVLGCQDCHFAHTHIKGPWAVRARRLPMAFESTGDLADVAVVRRTLDEFSTCGVRSIVWSGGGEPTTHPHWLACVEHAAAVGLEQGMYTCGGLLTTETGRRLAQLASWVVVSLDAPDGASYAAEKGVPAARFEAACDGLRSLVGHRAVVGASFLLHGENVERAPEMLMLGRRLGATYTTFRPAVRTAADHPSVCVDERSWIWTELDDLALIAGEPDVEMDLARFANYAAWREHGYTDCHGIQLHTTITPDGRVWVCPQRRGVTAIGDVSRESFAAVWARHPRTYRVDDGCRALCRLHPVNETLAGVRAHRVHEAFV